MDENLMFFYTVVVSICSVSGNLVLRVPVLYGPVEYLAESAVTVLLNSLLQTDKPCKVSDCELRCPSHVDDIADICLQMAVKRLEVSVLYGHTDCLL